MDRLKILFGARVRHKRKTKKTKSFRWRVMKTPRRWGNLEWKFDGKTRVWQKIQVAWSRVFFVFCEKSQARGMLKADWKQFHGVPAVSLLLFASK